MIRRRRHAAATQGTTRLEAFTDGVFAIAATLLVLVDPVGTALLRGKGD